MKDPFITTELAVALSTSKSASWTKEQLGLAEGFYQKYLRNPSFVNFLIANEAQLYGREIARRLEFAIPHWPNRWPRWDDPTHLWKLVQIAHSVLHIQEAVRRLPDGSFDWDELPTLEFARILVKHFVKGDLPKPSGEMLGLTDPTD